MSGELARLPVTCAPAPGEAIDGYLERLAEANGMERPHLVRRIRSGGARTTFLTTASDPLLLAHLAALTATSPELLAAGTLAALPGIDASGLNAAQRATWRTVASRGWPPEHGTALCPPCLAEDGVWRLAWRHPWVTVCARHRAWLVGECPTCRRRFRSHRTPLLPVDAPIAACGNPAGTRGQNCLRVLAELPAEPARGDAVTLQQRIDTALKDRAVVVIGSPVGPAEYLLELRALSVLLLHLVIQSGGDEQASWADAARMDHRRSDAGRGARWGLVPPRGLMLRGSALAAADAILRRSNLEAAADALHPWTELAPQTRDGQLGWLADHTTMTPTLTQLVMTATATRRRITTLLDQAPNRALPGTAIPQVIPAGLCHRHLVGMLDVTDHTGRLYAALCLARRHIGAATWAEAANVLGLAPDVGVKTARACSGDVLVVADRLVQALDRLADDLDTAIDYRAREVAVRSLAQATGWYRQWAQSHLPGSHSASQSYAITWLWTEYAHGHLDTSPGWSTHPDGVGRARYRRYATRLTPTAKDALVALVRCPVASSPASCEPDPPPIMRGAAR